MMMMKSKAQAAMEFLMTYGWVIMMVLIVVGVLAYMGVFNFRDMVPERCELQSDLKCLDYKVTLNGGATSNVRLVVQNGLGYGIYVTNVSITADGVPANQCYNYSSSLPTHTQIPNGVTKDLIELTNCQSFPSSMALGNKKKFNVKITYYLMGSDPGNSHIIQGELFTKVYTS
jgi:uncharacterized protein (UPF0333 family)